MYNLQKIWCKPLNSWPEHHKVDFWIDNSLQLNDHYSLIENPIYEPFVDGQSGLDYLSFHMHHGK
jgi:hypothetical protein